MRAATRARVCEGWARAFQLAPADLAGGRVHISSLTDEPAGVLVVQLPDATLVGSPPEHHERVSTVVARLGASALMEPVAWAAELPDLLARTQGPSLHLYADDEADLGPVDERVLIAPPGVRAALQRLARTMPVEEWREAGFDDPGLLFTIMERRAIVAAAHLSPWDGHLADLGFVTRPNARGRGYGTIVVAAAARDAISRHGAARWRSRSSNAASLAVARRLGFERFGQQLAIELRSNDGGPARAG